MPYEISIARLPPAITPLSPEAVPKGHSIEPRHAETVEEALGICRELMEEGYEVSVKGPNISWDQAEINRRLKSA